MTGASNGPSGEGEACRVSVLSADNPGAVAILRLWGPGVAGVLKRLSGEASWPTGRLRLVDLGGVDRGIAVRIDETTGELMPHGGPRIVRLLLQRLAELGVDYEASPPAAITYPEAAHALEAEMLATLAAAASPAAVDHLLAQPALWQHWLEQPPQQRPDPAAVLRHSDACDRLVHPATVVVLGQANVGKSTLSNAMLGREVSVVADLPGTTRDWTASLAELVPQGGGTHQAVAVRWLDTPGLRVSDDPVEQAAIELAGELLRHADLRLAVRDPERDWPTLSPRMPRPELWLLNKVDTLGPGACEPGGEGCDPLTPLRISAVTGQGLDQLRAWVWRRLSLPESPGLWAFCPALRAAVADHDVDVDAVQDMLRPLAGETPQPGGT